MSEFLIRLECLMPDLYDKLSDEERTFVDKAVSSAGQEALDAAFDEGYEAGHEAGWDAGHEAGWDAGHEAGYESGHEDGAAAALATP